METSKLTAVWLLNLANDMRIAKGDDPLDDLPMSERQNAERCIIANAFNYGCVVEPDEAKITFQSVEDVDTYFKVMGLDKSNYDYEGDPDLERDEDGWYVGQVFECMEAPMTPELVEIAEDFDSGLVFQQYAEKEEDDTL